MSSPRPPGTSFKGFHGLISSQSRSPHIDFAPKKIRNSKANMEPAPPPYHPPLSSDPTRELSEFQTSHRASLDNGPTEPFPDFLESMASLPADYFLNDSNASPAPTPPRQVLHLAPTRTYGDACESRHRQDTQRKEDVTATVRPALSSTLSAPEHPSTSNLGTTIIGTDTAMTDIEAQKPKKVKKEKKPISGPCRRALNFLYPILVIDYFALAIFFLVYGSPRSEINTSRVTQAYNPKRVWAIVLGSVMMGGPPVGTVSIIFYMYIRYGCAWHQ